MKGKEFTSEFKQDINLSGAIVCSGLAEELVITPAVHQDWPAFENMFAAAFQTDIYYPLMKRRLDLAKKFYRLSKTIATLFVGNVYLLRLGNRPIGFIMLKKIGDKKMHLHYVAVAPEFRRQGLGKELVGFVIKIASECGCDLYLETEADSPAMKLYSSLGFGVDGQFHIYRLVAPSASTAGQTTDAELIPVNDNKGMLTLAKERLLGYRSSVLRCNLRGENPLSFRICSPTSGSAAIIHCSHSGGDNELLYQALPHLAFSMNTPSGAYLVLSGGEQAIMASPWLGNRSDYVTMTKKHQP